jgi:hypothetical protein
MIMTNASISDLRRALVLRTRIDAMVAELSSLLGGTKGPRSTSDKKPRRKRRRMSAAARAKIAAAQKARWARLRAGKGK